LRREAPAVGCDIGGTAIKLVRLRGRAVEESVEVPTPAGRARREILDAIAGAVRRVSPLSPGLRVGVAVPGFLDAARRRVVRLSNLPRLDGVPLAPELERRLGVGVVLDADTNAGAVAEARLGAGAGHERVLYLTAGTGLGAALAVRGEPVRVSRHTVGQVAHIPLIPRGPPCPCGGRGCAEAVLGARGVLRRARRAGIRARSPEEICRMARPAWPSARERAAARAVWREVGGAMGGLLGILAALFSPDAIVVGGGLAGAADLFLPAARRGLGGRRVVLPAARGRFAGAIGMALLARGAPSLT
jgi:glucokinase